MFHPPSRRGAARLCTATAIALGTLLGAAAHAQDYPARQVKITTPFPAGSGPEVALRMVADKLAKMWGKPVLVDNRPGANGFIAIEAVKRAAPDGHELVQMDSAHLTAHPFLFKKLPYDPKGDFEPLTPLFRNYFFVVTPVNTLYKSVGELLADARARPDKLTYGSWFVGSPGHLGAALLEAGSNTRMVHVPYKEMSQLYGSVANSEVVWAFGSVASAGALQRAGKVRFLAVAAPRRVPGYMDVPTVAESGGPPDFEVSAWTALLAPKGTPRAVVEKIQRDVAKALAEPDVRERYAAFAYEPYPLNSEQFARQTEVEAHKYGDIIRKVNITLD